MIEVLGAKAPPSDHAESYSGMLRLRLPKYLHATLARRATLEGVSLNQIMVALLAERAAAAPKPARTKAKAAPTSKGRR